MRKKMPTTQIRPSVTIETASILEHLKEKTNIPIGAILEFFLNESETFNKIKKKIYDVNLDEFIKEISQNNLI